MRRGMTPAFLYTEDKQLLGVSLSSDFCTEHECGIDGIRSNFLMVDALSSENRRRDALGKDYDSNPLAFGIDRVLVRTIPENLTFTEVKGTRPKLFMLTTSRMVQRTMKEKGEITKQYIPHDLYIARDTDVLGGAWDDSEFGIIVSEDHLDELKTLADAFLEKDICIGGKFGTIKEPSGLLIVIASRIPESDRKLMWDADEDKVKLKAAAKATGIEEYLRSKGMRWYALSPSWANEEKTEVKFWLNPLDQQNNGYGFFTVEELRLWPEGKGPIPRKPAVQH